MVSIPIFLLLSPLALQGIAIAFDEFYFHHQRGLGRWERIGHPLDTVTVLSCFAFLVFAPVNELNLEIYLGLSFFSCVFVTKDEFIHTEVCEARENWLHALLFVLHPIVLLCGGVVWYFQQHTELLLAQSALLALFLIYQIIYWSKHGERRQHDL